jgi:hypothetical protein
MLSCLEGIMSGPSSECRLPVELVARIFDFLIWSDPCYPRGESKTLRRLVRLATCNRTFYDLAIPRILGVATLGLSAVPFLLAKPHLRGHVRRARFFCADSTRLGFNTGVRMWPPPSVPPRRNIPLLLGANEIRDLGLDDEHLEELRCGSRVADSDLLVRLCGPAFMVSTSIPVSRA